MENPYSSVYSLAESEAIYSTLLSKPEFKRSPTYTIADHAYKQDAVSETNSTYTLATDTSSANGNLYSIVTHVDGTTYST